MEIIILIIVLYLAFKKGIELLDQKKAVYHGNKKNKQWRYLRQIYDYLPEDPHKVFFSTNELKIVYYFGRFSISIIISYNNFIKKFKFQISITDKKLAKIANALDKNHNPVNPDIKGTLNIVSKIDHLNDPDFTEKIIAHVFKNYKQIINIQLKESYEKTQLSIS